MVVPDPAAVEIIRGDVKAEVAVVTEKVLAERVSNHFVHIDAEDGAHKDSEEGLVSEKQIQKQQREL